MLAPLRVDADRRQQHQLPRDVQAVDLDHQEIELRQVGRHELRQPLRRQSDEPPRGRRLRSSVAVHDRKTILRQPHRAPDLARRDVDQHQVHRPLAEPLLLHRLRPRRQLHLPAALPAPAHARTRHIDVAAVERDLALRGAPAVADAPGRAGMPVPAQLARVRFQHRLQSLDPRRQAKALEAVAHILPRLLHPRRDGQPPSRDSFRHGVALLSGNRHPEPTGSRRATPPHPISTDLGTSPGLVPCRVTRSALTRPTFPRCGRRGSDRRRGGLRSRRLPGRAPRRSTRRSRMCGRRP